MNLSYDYVSGAGPKEMSFNVNSAGNGRVFPLKEYNRNGYTLLEAMISLIILLVFSLALFERFRNDNTLSNCRREYVAMRLIEREATLIRAFPHEMMPVRRHTINDNEWTLRTYKTDAGVICYTITAEVSGIVAARAMFYARKTDEKR